MTKLTLLLFRKRFFLFALLMITTFLMNLFLWNETSQLIRMLPRLSLMNQEDSEEIFEVIHMPDTVDGFLMKTYSDDVQNEVFQVLSKGLYKEGRARQLYYGKENYLTATGELIPLSKEKLPNIIEGIIPDVTDINDLLVFNTSQEELRDIEASMTQIGFPLRFASWSERYHEDYDYYFGNFIFGLCLSLAMMGFSFLIIYWLVSSLVKICQQDIRVFQIVGITKRTIKMHLSFLIILPIIFVLSPFFFFAYSIAYSIIIADYIYIFGINAVLAAYTILIVNWKLRRVLNA